MAAGFTVSADKIKKLKVFLNSEFKKSLADPEVHLHEQYTLDLTSVAASLELISEISIMEPFGNGNPAPIFRFSNIYVLKADVVASKAYTGYVCSLSRFAQIKDNSCDCI